jgi:hypothetical protein
LAVFTLALGWKWWFDSCHWHCALACILANSSSALRATRSFAAVLATLSLLTRDAVNTIIGIAVATHQTWLMLRPACRGRARILLLSKKMKFKSRLSLKGQRLGYYLEIISLAKKRLT